MSADTYITLKPQQQAVGHQWTTGIIGHVKGKEQRSSYFTWPRITTQTRFSLTNNAQRNWFQRHVYKYGYGVVGVPLWHDQMAITTAISGALTVTVDSTAKRHLTIGRELLLINKADPDIYFAASIAGTTDTTVTLESVLNHTYTAADSYCMPVVESRIKLSGGIKASRVSNSFVQMSGNEDYSVQRDYFYTPPTATAATYLGHIVADFRFNHSKTFKYDHPNDVFQNIGMSYIESSYAGTDTNISADINAELINRSEIWDFWTFFDSVKGQYAPFWLPTWTQDMTITSALVSGNTTFTVVPNKYDSFYLDNDIINRHIIFSFPDRTWMCRKIVNYNDSTGLVTLSTVLGVDVEAPAAAKTMVSFLIFSRFANDTVIAQYQAAQAAYIGFETRGLIQESL